MTWHEYVVNGVAPTFWLLVVGGGCVLLTVAEIHERRSKRRPFGGVLIGSTAFVLFVAMMCLGTLADRVDAYRLRNQAAPATTTGSYFTGSSDIGSASGGISSSIGSGTDGGTSASRPFSRRHVASTAPCLSARTTRAPARTTAASPLG